MRKFYFILCAFFCVTMAKAENVIDIDMDEACNYFVKEKASDNLSSLLENTSFEENTAQNSPVEIEGIKTYKNWLGEDCIDFGNAPKSYYNWKRDVTYAGIPLFLASFIIKDQKRAFRSARFAMNENWKTEIDNYTQLFPYLPVVGLKALGYDGRSSWDRLVTSALLSNAVMALAVNSTKYTVKEMRPDNSSANSFPSGHTATAFVAATVLHKEYGLTRSPWFSVGGYAVAMGTGFMRVLNNRHWISDVMAGAGIGILSTELGYFLGDIIYKNKGITRLELTDITNPNHPSFFDIQMGIGMHSKHMEAYYDDGDYRKMDLGTSTAVGVEGAYFFNKYFGIGGMARVTTTPIKGLGLSDDEIKSISELNTKLVNNKNADGEPNELPSLYNIKAANSNLIDGSFDVGVYGNLPLSKHFSLGAKFLVGARVNGGFEYKANTGYRMQAQDADGNFINTYISDFITGEMGKASPVYIFENPDGSLFNSNETLLPGVSQNYNYHLDPQRFQSGEYTISKLTGGSSINYVFGLSATYKYKENFSWKIFLDYDTARNRYNYTFKLFDDQTMDYMKYNGPDIYNDLIGKTDYKASFSSRFNLFTIGASFSINF